MQAFGPSQTVRCLSGPSVLACTGTSYCIRRQQRLPTKPRRYRSWVDLSELVRSSYELPLIPDYWITVRERDADADTLKAARATRTGPQRRKLSKTAGLCGRRADAQGISFAKREAAEAIKTNGPGATNIGCAKAANPIGVFSR